MARDGRCIVEEGVASLYHYLLAQLLRMRRKPTKMGVARDAPSLAYQILDPPLPTGSFALNVPVELGKTDHVVFLTRAIILSDWLTL